MKYFVISIGVITISFTASAHAEVTNCIEITSLPTTISSSGVYCLKQNLSTAATSGNAIDVQANDVTIELNGWILDGSAAGTGTATNGIYSNTKTNITVRNGTIRGFRRGVYLVGSSAGHHLVERVASDANRSVGLSVQGDEITVRDNRVFNTGPADVGNSAFGISITSAENFSISGNRIAGVAETLTNTGIYVGFSSRGEVIDNLVVDMVAAAYEYGIYFAGSSDVSVAGNRIINTSTGRTAIFDATGSTGIDCVDNIIRGYTTGTPGCDYLSGNQVN